MATPKCFFSGCENVAKNGDPCGAHSAQLSKHGGMFPLGHLKRQVSKDPMPTCSVSHCEFEANSRAEGALCDPHYQRQWRGKDPSLYYVQASGVRTELVCIVPGCVKRASTQKVCKAHRESIAMGRIECPPETFIPLNPPCSFDGCPKLARSQRGVSLCHGHYTMQLGGVPLKALNDGAQSRGEIPCGINDCPAPAKSHGLCGAHSSKVTAYGITPLELIALDALKVCQNVFCDNTENLVIDHGHDSGKVRDVLCGGCNTALGFTKEDSARLRGLADYIEKHS